MDMLIVVTDSEEYKFENCEIRSYDVSLGSGDHVTGGEMDFVYDPVLQFPTSDNKIVKIRESMYNKIKENANKSPGDMTKNELESNITSELL